MQIEGVGCRLAGRQIGREGGITVAGRSLKTLVTFWVAAALLSACSQSTPQGSGEPQPSAGAPVGQASAVAQPLECVKESYPCSLAEVDPTVLERSSALGDEAATRAGAGSSMPEVEAWLRTQSDVAEVESDDDAVRFRLTGGRPVWVLGERALPDRASTPGATDAEKSTSTGSPSDGREPMLASITGGLVAQRKALVLSPMLWDFGESDDGAPVAEILELTRGYESGVTYRSNVSEDSTDVGIDDFRGWHDYDVVHVSSHGTRLCKVSPCRAVIIATLYGGALADLPERGQPGVEIIKSVHRRTFLGLSADFFREQYPGGLEDTLVFFNACETYGAGSPANRATDLGDAIRGTTSVYLGWSEVVNSENATLASVALFQGLSQRGLTIGDGHTGIGELQVDRDPDGKQAVLGVSERAAGGDLRIRDVISLRSRASGGQLAAGESVAIEGKVGDGQPDDVPYRVLVEGMDATTAAEAVVHVSAGEREAPPVAASSGTPAATAGSWTLQGSITLDHDVTAPEPADLRAWIELPDSGISEHRTSATLVGSSPLGSAWKGTASDIFNLTADGLVKIRATAELTFTLAPGQDPGARYVRFEQTAGTMKWQTIGTDSEGCASLSPLLTIPITPEIASNAEISFDTSLSPIEYRATSHVTNGPEVEVTQTCPDKTKTYTTRANATFILAFSDEHRTVVADQISGEARIAQSVISWQLTKVE